jgi:hypothetical protein
MIRIPDDLSQKLKLLTYTMQQRAQYGIHCVTDKMETFIEHLPEDKRKVFDLSTRHTEERPCVIDDLVQDFMPIIYKEIEKGIDDVFERYGTRMVDFTKERLGFYDDNLGSHESIEKEVGEDPYCHEEILESIEEVLFDWRGQKIDKEAAVEKIIDVLELDEILTEHESISKEIKAKSGLEILEEALCIIEEIIEQWHANNKATEKAFWEIYDELAKESATAPQLDSHTMRNILSNTEKELSVWREGCCVDTEKTFESIAELFFLKSPLKEMTREEECLPARKYSDFLNPAAGLINSWESDQIKDNYVLHEIAKIFELKQYNVYNFTESRETLHKISLILTSWKDNKFTDEYTYELIVEDLKKWYK